MKKLCTAVAALALFAAIKPVIAEPLQANDLVAVCGDSITEQHMYSALMEDYFLMCKPAAGVKAEQFGWGGETTWGFDEKMDNFTIPFHATVATTCYGMNDGGYAPLNKDRADKYRAATTSIIAKLKKAGVRTIVVGSPGAVDFDSFRKNPKLAEMYNKTLGELTDIDRDIAGKEGLIFADVHSTMMDAMTKAKAKLGKTYIVAGPDGVHPGWNGHLLMAYAYLKALGVSGDIGTITVDLAGKTANATDGHKVLSNDGSAFEMESTKYPFCFTKEMAQMAEFLPFNDDLNRFKLVVKNPGADKITVTFGTASKTFTAEQLATGINLAAEFPENPFTAPFMEVNRKVQEKQGYETSWDKSYLNSMQTFKNLGADSEKRYQTLQAGLVAAFDNQVAAIPAFVKPVKYTIKLEAAK